MNDSSKKDIKLETTATENSDNSQAEQSPIATQPTASAEQVASPENPSTKEPSALDKGEPKSKSKPVATIAKPKNPQAVLFLLCESQTAVASRSEVSKTSNPTMHRIPREPLGQTPIIAATEFRDNIERFFIRRSTTKSSVAEFADANLLLFPVKTMRGVFTWVSSLEQLQRFNAKLKDTCCAPRWPLVGLDEKQVLSGPHNTCMLKEFVSVEEFNFPTTVESRVQGISRWLAANALPQTPEYQWWRAKLARDLLILPHELFTQIVEQNLQVQLSTTSAIDPNTAENTHFEEILPREAVFYSILGPSLANAELELPLTVIGRERSSGNGLCRLQLITRANNKTKRRKKPPQITKETASKPKEDLDKKVSKLDGPSEEKQKAVVKVEGQSNE